MARLVDRIWTYDNETLSPDLWIRRFLWPGGSNPGLGVIAVLSNEKVTVLPSVQHVSCPFPPS